MKKLLTALLLSISTLALTSCEEWDKLTGDDDKSNGVKLEKSIVVQMKSNDVIGGGEGDIYQYDGDGWRVIVTDNTSVYVQRGSCSGFDKVSPDQVQIGQTIFFTYESGSVDYTGNPNVVRASLIESYRSECLEPAPPEIL